MKIHEYQARRILSENGIPVPASETVMQPEEAAVVFKKFGGQMCVVKAQVYAGGRGKAGFVKLVKTAEEARDAAKFMLTHRMVSPQTGPEGVPVNVLLVAPGVDIAKEYYIGITIDRSHNTVTMIASAEGGVEIEEVAAKSPEKVLKVPLHPLLGLQPYQARKIAGLLGFQGAPFRQFSDLLLALYRLFIGCDCSMVEINPLVVTPDGKVLALDAKFNFDDNALFRHPDILAMRDTNEEDPREVEASKFGLNYIGLDGNIACLVNGAGLAMATMDIIQYAGGKPANFLDVGGGASKDQVSAAFKIILADPQVKGILVNIFGGIMDCNVIATGIVAAAREIGLKIPLVVRLEGNNVAAGKTTLADSGIAITSAEDLADAAKKIVAAVAAATE